MVDQGWPGDVLGRLRRDADDVTVFGGDEALRYDLEEIDRGDQDQQREHQDEEFVAQHEAQAALVETDKPEVLSLRGLIEAAMMDEVLFAEKTAAEHRGQGQADQAADQDRDADGHREFAEQPAENAAEKEQRDEDGGQREGHRDDGETDLARPVEGGLHAALAHLQMPDDILQHDDGVVDDETDRQGQRHQRDVVDGVVEQVHDREGAEDRHRQGQAGDDGGREVADEEKDHQHHQDQGQQQGEPDIVDRGLDRLAGIAQQGYLYRLRQRVPEGREQRFHPFRDLQRVTAGLFLDGQKDRMRALAWRCTSRPRPPRFPPRR